MAVNEAVSLRPSRHKVSLTACAMLCGEDLLVEIEADLLYGGTVAEAGSYNFNLEQKQRWQLSYFIGLSDYDSDWRSYLRYMRSTQDKHESLVGNAIDCQD